MPKDKKDQNSQEDTSNSKDVVSIDRPLNWDHEEDNCGINPEDNPCGDANEY